VRNLEIAAQVLGEDADGAQALSERLARAAREFRPPAPA
jgi:hypothetical protein